MGNYTEFIIDCKLKDNTNEDVIRCLQDMVNNNENYLFSFGRNPLINYVNKKHKAKFDGLILRAHGELKNYSGEIVRFVDFIKPHVEIGFLENGNFAKSKYEEFDDWKYFNIE